MHPKTRRYLGMPAYGRDMNLETKDIAGAIPLNHYGRLEQKIAPHRPHDPTPVMDLRTQHLSHGYGTQQLGQTKGSSGHAYAHPHADAAVAHSRTLTPQHSNRQVEDNRVHFKDQGSSGNQAIRGDRAPENGGGILKKTERPVNSKSQDIRPDYKYVGKTEKRTYYNKADARLDVHDINEKHTKYDNMVPPPTEKEQQRLNRFNQLRNLDIHKPELEYQPIERKLEYKDGHRVEAQKVIKSKQSNARIAPYMRPTVYDFINPAAKEMTEQTYIKQYEAKALMNLNPKILRDLGPSK